MRRLVEGLAGCLIGFLAGLAMALGVLVARARLQDTYVNALSEVSIGFWLPLFVATGAGLWVGISRRRRLAPWVVGCLGGIAAGAGLGAFPGIVVGAEPAWPWAGGTMGAALGALVGAAVGWFRSGAGGETGSAAAAAWALLLAGSAIACDTQDGPLPPDVASEPLPDSVESVVFLLGDPGQGRIATHPVLPRLQQDIERWSEHLGGDRGRVALLILGDIIYPDGLSAPEASGFPTDSARLEDQVELVAGPAARQAETRAFFLAGNHDWGQRGDWEGAVRLHRLAGFLERRRARGVHVHLEPPAGTGGPTVVDVGDHLRLVLLDTAWWLLEGERAAKQAVLDGVEEALASAGDRRVVMAAHHPFHSAGPHGELLTLGSTLGIRTLLARSGALLQDLSSRPYWGLREALVELGTRHRPPDVFAGGHEHSLQVLEPRRPGEPDLSVVVGSGSKLTDVGAAAGMLVGASSPGYGILYVLRDGTLRIQLEATPRTYLSCPEEDADCMDRGLEGFRTIWDGSL